MALVRSAPKRPRPTTAIAEFYPARGQWAEDDYLTVAETNRLVELSEGNLEVVAMPTHIHQRIIVRLLILIEAFLQTHRIGTVNIAPLPVRLWPGKMREPDLMFMKKSHASRIGNEFWGVPDFVVEILSTGTQRLDRVTKKREYAQAGIPEYWIVDPEAKVVEVFTLRGETFRSRGKFGESDTITATQMPGFSLNVADLFVE